MPASSLTDVVTGNAATTTTTTDVIASRRKAFAIIYLNSFLHAWQAGRHIVCFVTEVRITSHTFLCINLFRNRIITIIHVQV